MSRTYLVVWRDERNNADRWADIYGRSVSARGAPLADDVLLSSRGALNDEVMPQLAVASTGDFLVVWQTDVRESGSGIYGRLLTNTGILRTAMITIRPAGQQQGSGAQAPSVAWDPATQRYLVAWNTSESTKTSAGPLVASSIEIEALTKSGARLGGSQTIARGAADGSGNDASQPVVAASRRCGAVIVLWQQSVLGDQAGLDIVGRLVDLTQWPVRSWLASTRFSAAGSESGRPR